jgi:hypothetical protein
VNRAALLKQVKYLAAKADMRLLMYKDHLGHTAEACARSNGHVQAADYLKTVRRMPRPYPGTVRSVAHVTSCAVLIPL